MRRVFRLLVITISVTVFTVYVSLIVRFRPAAVRPALRARYQQIGARMVCRMMGVRVSMRGGALPEKPVLVICNHVSAFDPLMLGSQMSLAFAGKVEIGSWPVIGWVCRTFGMLFVNRSRRTTTGSFVEQVQEKLRAGVSILVFPEGTTGWGDTVQPFKTGAFEAVADSDEDMVLPLFLHVVAVEGEPAGKGRRREISHNGQSFSQHTWHVLGLKRIDIQIEVGTPLPTNGRDRKMLAQLAYRAVSGLAEQSLVEA